MARVRIRTERLWVSCVLQPRLVLGLAFGDPIRVNRFAQSPIHMASVRGERSFWILLVFHEEKKVQYK